MLRLTFEREKRKLSRAELARRAKMSAGDVGKIENGRVKPYRVQLVKLGRAMRMRVPEALTLADEIDYAKVNVVVTRAAGELADRVELADTGSEESGFAGVPIPASPAPTLREALDSLTSLQRSELGAGFKEP